MKVCGSVGGEKGRVVEVCGRKREEEEEEGKSVHLASNGLEKNSSTSLQCERSSSDTAIPSAPQARITARLCLLLFS